MKLSQFDGDVKSALVGSPSLLSGINRDNNEEVKVSFTSDIWLYEGGSPWHFISLPSDIADIVNDIATTNRRGFGSVKVTVTIGNTSWLTSLFPYKNSKSYILPIKKNVRVLENLQVGSRPSVTLEID